MATQSLYSSLPLGVGEIRVLTILPGDWAAAIHCELSVVSLSVAPEFTALSYAWGVPIFDGTLYINGQEQRIGRNLETALRYYRRAGWCMPLWADAVCINQGDVPERSAQVAIMDRIYSSAATVFVVLGAGVDLAADDYFQKVRALQNFRFSTYNLRKSEAILPPGWEQGDSQAAPDDEETSFLFNFLERAATLKCFDHLSDVGRWGAVSRESEESEYSWQTLIQILEAFTKEAWWTRIWTLQESVVGVKLTFVYRTAVAPWVMLEEAASIIGAHITDCCTPYLANEAPPRYAAAVRRLITHINSIKKTRRVYARTHDGIEAEQLSLTQLFPKKDFQGSAVTEITGSPGSNLLYKYLWMHYRREASDPRDKIYALLSLTKLGDTPSFIYPDYSKRQEDVYISTARLVIQDSGSLDLLSAAGRLRSDNLPSWVPDWSIMGGSDENATQTSALLMYNAGLETKAEVSFHESNHSLLNAEGVILDNIGVLGQGAISERQDGRDIWQAIFEWMQIAYTHSPSTKWVDFCRTICAGLIMWPQDLVFRRMGPLTAEMIQSQPPRRDPASGNYTRDIPAEELIQSSVEQMKTCFSAWHILLWRQAERGMVGMAPPPTMEDHIKITTALRRFVVSSSGYIGLVPSNSEKGDCIIFFKGCRFPCVVRPISRPDDKKTWYKIVGDCYIDGFMDGQINDHVSSKIGDRNFDWKTITLC